MRILLNNNALLQVQKDLGMTDQEFASHIGVSRSQLWRARLPVQDKRFSLGQDFIARVLNACPNMLFEQLFFLDRVYQPCDKVVV